MILGESDWGFTDKNNSLNLIVGERVWGLSFCLSLNEGIFGYLQLYFDSTNACVIYAPHLVMILYKRCFRF